MTTKRDSKSKPTKNEQPMLKKETLKDLPPNRARAVALRGGVPPTFTADASGCGS